MGKKVDAAQAREIESRYGYRLGGTSRTVTRLAGMTITLRERVAVLEAMTEGRATPPTDAEIAAHAATGGRWRARWMFMAGGWMFMAGGWMYMNAGEARRVREESFGSMLWWPLDANDRLCAWPVVELPC